MIDYAEALTVIDVNTGSFTGRGKSARLEDTITKTNLEAAEEVVNQLRLRDIGGIIVIDFIDMARARNRDAVLKVLRKALDEDRTKTFVVEISPLGLVEMTRQNVTDGVREIMTKPCPTCDGEGVVKSEETIAIEVERRAARARRRGRRGRPEAYLVRLNPRVTRAGSPADGARELHALEEETGTLVPLRGLRGPAARPLRGHAEGTRDEIEEQRRAVPRAARRCTSTSSSRTCTTTDDAVAKVDGYMIEVANGDRRSWARRSSCGSRRPGARWPRGAGRAEAEEAAGRQGAAKAAKARAAEAARGGQAGRQARGQGQPSPRSAGAEADATTRR